jgi:hypothetical protein
VEEFRGLVLIGEVIGAEKDRVGSAAWLRDLVGELDAAYGEQRTAAFGFLQGDELQGQLSADSDPLLAVLHAALGPASRPIRWVCVSGCVDPGEGPATERTGQAYAIAHAAMKAARTRHDRLVLTTGSDAVDELLSDLTPVLADLLDGLTARQRDVARLALLDGLRQSEVAGRLGVRRATISVSFARARIQSLTGLAAAIRRLYATGSSSGAAPNEPSRAIALGALGLGPAGPATASPAAPSLAVASPAPASAELAGAPVTILAIATGATR